VTLLTLHQDRSPLREWAFLEDRSLPILPRKEASACEVTVEIDELELQGLVPKSRWSRRGFVMTSLATGFAISVQPIAAQTVITTDTSGLTAGEVKVPAKDGEVPAYYAMPDKGGPFPTVLVAHEAWGVHEHIKDLCRRLAKAGYYAIAPELFARYGNAAAMTTQDELRKLMGSVPDEQAMSDLDATVAFAKASVKADTAKLAITGFCWGGRVTWLYAAHNPGLKAAVSWYGVDRPASELTPKNPADLAADLKCPVLALYGGADQLIPPEMIEKRQAACKAAGKTCESKVYPDTPHGFNADYRPSYRADQAKDGWAKMLAWFKDHGAA
jgi:carboxymethylenebutenolidase